MRGAEQVLAGTARFRLQGRLGDGGGGVVYRAFDREVGREVALKLMHGRRGSERARLSESFALLRRLSHPNLVQLYDLIEDEERVMLVMELIEGVDLLTYVRPTGRSFDELRVRKAFGQLAQALSALHRQGKVHLDVKPENVRVTAHGRLALLDLDLVLDVDLQRSVLGERMLPIGTAHYMAPEQAGCARPSMACDWYSMGVALYEALTGVRPYAGTDLEVLLEKQSTRPRAPGTLASGLPPDLEQLCEDLLARSPSERPSGAEVLRRLGVDEDVLSARWTSASLLSARPPFVGRKRELACIAAAFARSRRGATVLRVRGEVGVGKTSLCEEALRRLARTSPDLLALSSACPRYPERAHAALHDAVARAAQVLRSEGSPIRLPVGPSALRLLERMFPGALVDVEAKSPGRSALPPDPLEQRWRAIAALRALFVEVTARRALVLWLDDYHWADLDTQRLVRALVAGPDAPKLLLLLSEEPAPGAFATSSPAAHETLVLSELTGAAVAELADALAGRAGALSILPRVRSEISPQLLIEQVRHALWNGGPPPPDASYGWLLAERLAALEEPALGLLQLVCAAFDPLPIAICERACELSASAFTRHVAALSMLGLVRSTSVRGEDCLAPTHARVAEQVDLSLSGRRRELVHEQLARALSARDATHASGALLRHQIQSGAVARAAESAAVSARQAYAALAYQRAAELFTLQASLNPSGPGGHDPLLARRMADALTSAGWSLSAATLYREAAERASPTEASYLRQRALEQLLAGGEIEEALELAEGLLASSEGARDRESALWSLHPIRLGRRLRGAHFRERDESRIARSELRRVDLAFATAAQLSRVDAVRGAALFARALADAQAAGEPQRVGRALCATAWSAAGQRAFDGARSDELLRLAGALGERQAWPLLDGHRRLARGMLALASFRVREASAHCRDAERVLRDSCADATWEIATAQVHHLLALTLMGRHGEARAKIARTLEEAEERGDAWTYTQLLALEALGPLLAAGEPAAAARRLAEAESRWSAGGRLHTARLLRLLAATSVDLYRGGPHAELLLAQRRTELELAPYLRSRFVALVLAELGSRARLSAAMAGADLSRMRDIDAQARKLARAREPAAQGFGRLLAGQVHALRGQPEIAARHFEQGIARLEPLGLSQWVLPARCTLGRLLGGEHGRAIEQRGHEELRERGVTEVPHFIAMMLPAYGALA